MPSGDIHKNHRKRLRREFENAGLMRWQEHVVLEFLLFYAIPRRNTNDIAHSLIERCGGFLNVFSASKEQLMSVKGVGESAADYITALGELIKYINCKKFSDDVFVLNSDRCEKYLINLFDGEKEERFYMICLDTRNRIIYQDVLFEGGFESIELDSVKVARKAVACGAACVVFAHNHPSGVARPSYADIEATRVLEAKLKVVGIGVIDHMIVAGGKCASMRELKYMTEPLEKLRKKYGENE